MTQGISLHIGLNEVDPEHYGGWRGVLNACESDAEDMATIARAYRSQLLLTKDATRDRVIAAIRDAASSLGEGDIFLVSYSGHGGQVKDENGDEEDDREDETWCLFDGELIDDELAVLWAEFGPGVRVLVVSDSCHSGTVTKFHYDRLVATRSLDAPDAPSEGKPLRFRAMPKQVANRTYRRNREFYQGLQKGIPKDLPAIRATVRLLSGCQDNQLSLDGTFNGLFTGTLLDVWAEGAFRGDYAAFHRAILGHMPPTQSPNHFVIGASNPAFDGQKPFAI